MSIPARILSTAIAVMVLIPAAAQAQMSPASFGVKAGVNLANLSNDADEDLKRLTGFVGGLFVSREVNENFGLQLEGLYSMRGAKTGGDGTKIKLNYIDVPLLARLGSAASNGTKFYVITGPQASFKVKGELEFEGETLDLEDDVKSFDFGWVIGAGLDYDRFTFDARYTLGLMNIDGSEDPAKIKNRTFAVMVGVRLN